MKKIKHSYQAPKVKVVSFKVEGGFELSVPVSVDQHSLVTYGQSNPKYETLNISFSGNDGHYF